MRTEGQEKEALRRAAEMLDDGASQREVSRTLRVSQRWVTKHFRGRGWTFRLAGEFRAMQMWGPKVEGLS